MSWHICRTTAWRCSNLSSYFFDKFSDNPMPCSTVIPSMPFVSKPETFFIFLWYFYDVIYDIFMMFLWCLWCDLWCLWCDLWYLWCDLWYFYVFYITPSLNSLRNDNLVILYLSISSSSALSGHLSTFMSCDIYVVTYISYQNIKTAFSGKFPRANLGCLHFVKWRAHAL